MHKVLNFKTQLTEVVDSSWPRNHLQRALEITEREIAGASAMAIDVTELEIRYSLRVEVCLVS